jgi:transmembrane 9 superfamily protein 1
MSDEDDDNSPEEENGWKIIHTDVFRFPSHRELFCSILGVGCQFLSIFTGILIFAVCGMFTVHRHGSLMASAVILYAFTSCIAGYVSGRMYRQFQGEHWTWNIILTSNLFILPFALVWFVINSFAWAHGSTQALPYTTVLIIAFMWLFVGFPLTVLGGIFGKNWTSNFDAPCRTKNISREIPRVSWYRTSFVRMLVGGFLPFSAISVELYYIFSTFWGREQYMLYGILTIVFLILLSVTACISIALTYFQLAAEDYRWWWQSILTSGYLSFLSLLFTPFVLLFRSTGLFVFFYAVFFYFHRSKMRGTLQTLQFFGYTSIACYIFFLMLGTVGFFSSLRFIRYIYINIKMD